MRLLPDGSAELCAAGVGDSALVVAAQDASHWDGVLDSYSGPSGPTGATASLPRSLASLTHAHRHLPPGSRVLLCSDGMAETFTPGVRHGADPDLALS